MVIDTVVFLAERGGSSLVNIRRHMLETYPETRSKQTASFNSLTQKALNAAVAGGKLERDKHTYKASSSYLRSLNKRDGIGGTGGGGGGRLRGSFAREDALFSGSNVELNRSLRLLMAERRGLRDNHLLAHMPLLAPFLQETVHIDHLSCVLMMTFPFTSLVFRTIISSAITSPWEASPIPRPSLLLFLLWVGSLL